MCSSALPRTANAPSSSCDDSAVRQIVDRAPVPALGAAVEALAMQHVVHVAGARPCARA